LEHGEANPTLDQITPQAACLLRQQRGNSRGHAHSVPDSLVAAGGHRQHLVAGSQGPDDESDFENAGADQAELVPRQRIGDLDQLQYTQVMASREKDRAERTRKLDTRSPVTGTKQLVPKKFLKNHRALDFDNVSNMKVEHTPEAASPSARESLRLQTSSPNGSLGKGDSRMEDADALQ
jgi:hypothetical protein